MSVFFTSDLHLGHEKIVSLSHRPFSSIQEHDKAIASNWAKAVKHDDIVWVLGDIAVEGTWKYALNILISLPGRKRLVMGNHDQAWVGKSDFMKYMAEYYKVFEIVVPWARASVEGVKVNLSHFPYEGDHTEADRFDMYRLRASDRPLLHGHTHSQDRLSMADYGDKSKKVPQVQVGVDAWDFTPVASHRLLRLLIDSDYGMEDRSMNPDQMKSGQWAIVRGKIVYK